MPTPPATRVALVPLASSRCPAGYRATSRPPSCVNPSRTVACTTARSSGESRPSAAPRSPCSTPTRTSSSAETVVCIGRGRGDRRRVLAESRDQSADPDAPDPGGNLAASPDTGRTSPHRHERVLHDFLHDPGVRTSARESEHQPRGVAPVELRERVAIARRHSGEQSVVAFGANGHHPSVAIRARIGSRDAPGFLLPRPCSQRTPGIVPRRRPAPGSGSRGDLPRMRV